MFLFQLQKTLHQAIFQAGSRSAKMNADPQPVGNPVQRDQGYKVPMAVCSVPSPTTTHSDQPCCQVVVLHVPRILVHVGHSHVPSQHRVLTLNKQKFVLLVGKFEFYQTFNLIQQSDQETSNHGLNVRKKLPSRLGGKQMTLHAWGKQMTTVPMCQWKK